MEYADATDEEIVDDVVQTFISIVMESTGNTADLSDVGEKIDDAKEAIDDDSVTSLLHKGKLHLLEDRAMQAMVKLNEAAVEAES
jgi:hypothetical protein